MQISLSIRKPDGTVYDWDFDFAPNELICHTVVDKMNKIIDYGMEEMMKEPHVYLFPGVLPMQEEQ